MTRASIGLLVCVALAAAPARAQAQDVDPQAEAERLFNEGNKHFDLAEWDLAIQKFRDAYRHLEEPLFLYNIAQAYRHKKDCVNARSFYKSYLRKVSTGDFAKKAKKFVTEMEKCIKDGGGDPTVEPPDPTLDPPDPEVDPKVDPEVDPKVDPEVDPKVDPEVDPKVDPETDPKVDPKIVAVVTQPEGPVVDTRVEGGGRPGRTKKIAGLAGAGVGVILAATGGYFTSKARAADRDVEAACEDTCTADEVAAFDRDGEAAQRNAGILYVAGGVAIAAGVAVFVWGVMDGREAPAAAQHVMIAPTRSGASVLARWTF